MLKTSGLVLDVHDDVGGEVLRSLFPSQDDIPEVVKTAHALTSDERYLLPDDDFALVLVDGDQKLRKYACHDEGNTILSVMYFLQNGHKLPEEAQKTAAANLLTACGWYNLAPPESLEKVAVGLSTGLALLNAQGAYQTAKGGIQQNMAGIRAAESQGHKVVTPHQMKQAEVSGSVLAPNQPPGDPKATSSKTVVQKTSAVMRPHVEVTQKEAHRPQLEKKASRYALGEKYPLDSYEQVKTAAVYFDTYERLFDPEDRHSFCSSLVKRANELGIELSTRIQKYGSEHYAPAEEIKMALDLRRNVLVENEFRCLLDELEEKRASINPDLYRAALEEFDKAAGIEHLYDHHIVDPYASTYGVKTAEDYSFVSGNDMITEAQLRIFGKTMHKSIKNSFGEDMADEFRKDPVGIFKSLPLDQKKMIMHLANNNAPGAEVIA